MTAATPGDFDRAPDGTAYRRTGRADARPLVLIHGLGLCRHVWQPFLAPLGERHQVLDYDLYGHGDSAPLPGEASLSAYAGQIRGLMDHCGIAEADLVGFSIGGMINRRFAMDFPDRCRSVTILNSPHDRGAEGQRLVEDRARQVREEGKMATMAAALERWFTPPFRRDNPEIMDLAAEWREKTDDSSYAEAALVLARGVTELTAPSPPIALPSLVATCENDTGSTPAMSHRIAAEIEGAEVFIVPGLRHLGLMEKPRLFLERMLPFLERT